MDLVTEQKIERRRNRQREHKRKRRREQRERQLVELRAATNDNSSTDEDIMPPNYDHDNRQCQRPESPPFPPHVGPIAPTHQAPSPRRTPSPVHYNSEQEVFNFIRPAVTSDSDSEEDPTNSLADELKELVVLHNVNGSTLKAIMAMFRKRGFNNLPKDPRTLLQTPRHVDIRTVSGMDYYFFGLDSQLELAIENAVEPPGLQGNEITLSLNVDGIPLFKDSRTAWPILCSVDNFQTSHSIFPLVITVSKAHSETKPNNRDFLNESIAALNHAIANGYDHDDIHYTVRVKCCICDTPARCMVRNCKLFNGYFGCDKCMQKGQTLNHRMVYMPRNWLPRTDDGFRRQTQIGHTKGPTPFSELENFDLVDDFPLDYMHLVCLGVVKKLIKSWVQPPRRPYSLAGAQQTRINERLFSIRPSITRDFARRPRKINEVDRWKATEFRQFLLYTGQIVLKNILPEDYYKHFLTLSVAISILVSPELTQAHSHYAETLLVHFNEEGAHLYGNEFLIYNVHCLVHLPAAARRYLSLENCSAWKFETYLYQLKKKIHSSDSPLAQLVKRIQECPIKTPVPEHYRISVKPPNNCFVTTEDNYVELVRKEANGTYFCREFRHLQPVYLYPCESTLLGLCKCTDTINVNNFSMKYITAVDLQRKCLKFNMQNNVVHFAPLLHCPKTVIP